MSRKSRAAGVTRVCRVRRALMLRYAKVWFKAQARFASKSFRGVEG